METEIWKDVPGLDKIQASTLGRIKSLKCNKELIRKTHYKNNGYECIGIVVGDKIKKYSVHALVAMAFLNHKPDVTQKIIVDHINNNKKDNRLINLQLITQRENSTKEPRGNSKYPGVHYLKRTNMYQAYIYHNKKLLRLGTYKYELDAAEAYKNYLKQIT